MDPSHEEQEIPTNDQRTTRPKSSKLPKSSNNQRDKSNNRAGSPPQDTSIHDIRQTFQVGLNKIANSQTREIGLKEIQGIIMTNNSPNNLRVYFSSLKDLKRHHDAATKEVEVLIFGYIATVYKTNLLDPLDKPPNLLKSVVRLCESIHSYFKDTNQGVQIACAKALTEVYLNCLQEEATDICSLIIIEPLLSILNGGADRATQQTAAYCLKEAIKVFQMKQKTELLDYTAPRLYNLFLKTNHDFAELLEALSIIILKVGIRSLQGKYTAFADKLCSIVNSTVVINQYYLIKVEACGVLLAFAYALRGAEIEQKVLDNLYEKVTSVLKDASKNKIYKVQQAASEALKFWSALKSNPEGGNAKLEVPALARQTEEDQITEQSEPDNKKNPAAGGALNNFKAIRNRFKQGKIEDNNNPAEPEPNNALRTTSQEPSEGINLVNAKYGSQNRGKNFMKARSGFGGGHVGWNSPERGDGKKMSHEKQKKNIKDLIMQKQLGGEKKSKFEFVAEEALQKHKAETGAARSKSPIRDEESEKKPVSVGKRPQSQGQKKYVEPKENSMDSSFKDVVLQSQNNDVRSENTGGSSRAGELRGNDSQNIDEGEDGEAIKVSRNASLRSETSTGANKKTVQKARPQTASQRAPQDLKKSGSRERGGNSSELQKDVIALEGKLASILGKSQQELTAEIQERAAQNRKLKNNAKQTTNQSRDLPIYKLTKEDEGIFKAMKYMDSSDFPSEANGIDPYEDGQNKREFASPERDIENENEGVNVSHKKVQQREKYDSQAPDPKTQQKAVELEDDEGEAEGGDEGMETAGFGGADEDLFQVEEMDQGDQGLLSWGKEKYNQAKKAIGLGPKEDKNKDVKNEKDEKAKAPQEESKSTKIEESKKPEVEQKISQPKSTENAEKTTTTEKAKPQEPETTKKPAEESPKKSEDKKVEARETEEIEEVVQKKEKKGGWLKNSMEWTKDKIGLGKNSRSPSPEKAQKDSAKSPEKEISKSPEKATKNDQGDAEEEVVQKEKKGGWLKNSVEWTKDHIGLGKKSRSASPEKAQKDPAQSPEKPIKQEEGDVKNKVPEKVTKKEEEVKTQEKENANETTEATVNEEVQKEKKGGWLKNSMEWTKDKIGLGKNSRSPSPEKAQKDSTKSPEKETSKSPEKTAKNDQGEEEEVQKEKKGGWLKESMEWTKDKIGLGKKSRSPSPEKNQNQTALPLGVVGGLAKGVQPATVAKDPRENKAKEPTKSQTDARMINIIKKYQQNESPGQPQLSQTEMRMKNLLNKNYAQEPEGIDDDDEEEEKQPQVKKQYEDRPIRPMNDQERLIREYLADKDVDYNEEDYEQPVSRENENKSLRASDERLDREINEGVRQNLGLSPIPHEHEEDDSEKFKKVPVTKNGQDLPTIRETVNDDQSREDMRDSLKDSLMPAIRTHFIKNRGGPQPEEAHQESPSIDDISDATPKNQNQNQNSQPGVIRAPQKQLETPVVEVKHSGTINLKKQDTFGPPAPKEEVKSEVQKPKIARVDTAHFNQPKAPIQQQRRDSSENTSTELAQSVPSSKPSNSEFNFKQNMQRLIQIQNELRDGTASTLTRLTSPQNVSATQEHYLECSQDGDDRSRKAHDKFSTVKYNTSHHPQGVYGPQEPNLDATEDEIQEEAEEEEPYYEPSAHRKPVPRESYPGNLSIKRNLNESDEFMESTMDEKALAAFIKQSGNSRKAFPVKVNQQFTEKPAKHPQKGVSFVDEPSYFVTQQNANLEETMAYDSVNSSFHPQSIIRNKINRPEMDHLADTMKSTDFEAVADFRKMYENLSQKPGAGGVASAGEIWKEASGDIAKGDYEAAYSKVLDAGDDIYLLRLLKITGSCMQKLNRGTALRLMKRIIVLQKSNFFDKMALGFFESAQKTRVIHNMKIEEQNLMLKELYKMSAKPNLLGETAANLHEVVTLDLKTTYL